MPTVIGADRRTGTFRYHALSFQDAGQNSYDCPPGQDPNDFELLTNVLPVTKGGLQRRWGYVRWAAPSTVVRRLYEYQNDSTLTRLIFAVSAVSPLKVFNEAGTLSYTLFTPGTGAVVPYVTTSRDVAYFADGVAGDLKQWDPTNSTRTWGATAPNLAPTPTVGGANSGHITLVQGRRYFLVFRDSTLNHYSDLSPVSDSTGATTMQNVVVSNLQVATDPRFDRKKLLATADGEDLSVLYELYDMPNSQTSYTDDVPEEDLLIANVYEETDDNGIEHGVAGNQPPPNGVLLGQHAGRLVMIVGGQYLRVSKCYAETITSTGALTGRHEECWPPEFEMDISPGAETVNAWISDGQSIWLGTDRHVRRISGTGPYDWQTPELAFNNVGVLNQDVWQVVYLEGTPTGSMWLTPDFRVIGSDFNNYQDAGAPIQDVLNTINQTHASKCHAAMYSSGAYNLYFLAIPTGANTECDTLCIYDLKKRKWFVWKLYDSIVASLANIQSTGVARLLFADNQSPSYIHVLGSSYVYDREGNGSLAIPVTIRTVWYHMDDPQMRKLLQELEVLTEDSALHVTIEGASTTVEFDTPSTVVSNAPIVVSPFGEYKVYLATKTAKDRFYRLTFTSATGVANTILDSFSLEAVPFNKI